MCLQAVWFWKQVLKMKVTKRRLSVFVLFLPAPPYLCPTLER